MQPVKIVIEGDFWDSQVYAGKLYLFRRDGSIHTLSWDELIHSYAGKYEEELKLSFQAAFCNSALLYGNQSQPLVQNSEIKSVITRQFERLSRLNLNFTSDLVESYFRGQQDSPFPFPHTDVCIYGKRMFASSHEGLFQAKCDGKSKNPVSTKVTKGWDAPVLSISASYQSLALAAGSEGLRELNLDYSLQFESSNTPLELAKGNFSNCNWLYFSIYGSSHITGGKLVDYRKDDIDEADRRGSRDWDERFKKKLIGIKTEKSLFRSTQKGYSWGNQDKIFFVTDNEIMVSRYNPWQEENRLVPFPALRLAAWKGQVVSAATALFGSVIECENAIVVLPTEGEAITIAGEPVNWRIFPRSKNYENHLHIIYNDRIEILSFNHDYFVDQDLKVLGIKKSQAGLRNRYFRG